VARITFRTYRPVPLRAWRTATSPLNAGTRMVRPLHGHCTQDPVAQRPLATVLKDLAESMSFKRRAVVSEDHRQAYSHRFKRTRIVLPILPATQIHVAGTEPRHQISVLNETQHAEGDRHANLAVVLSKPGLVTTTEPDED